MEEVQVQVMVQEMEAEMVVEMVQVMEMKMEYAPQVLVLEVLEEVVLRNLRLRWRRGTMRRRARLILDVEVRRWRRMD